MGVNYKGGKEVEVLIIKQFVICYCVGVNYKKGSRGVNYKREGGRGVNYKKREVHVLIIRREVEVLINWRENNPTTMRNIICVLGSGGHTYEMLLILKKSWNKINKCCFILGRDDWISLENIKDMQCREGIKILQCYRPTVVKEKKIDFVFITVLVCILSISVSIFVFLFLYIFNKYKQYCLVEEYIFENINNSIYCSVFYLLRNIISDIINIFTSIQSVYVKVFYLLRNIISDIINIFTSILS
ncbi:hypothetical protein CWI38_0691p0010, partial [Hamiltosporidium tvaerminnensis]